MSRFREISIQTIKTWWNADPLSSSAAVAYYAVFSIPSFLIILITIAGAFINPTAVRNNVAFNLKGVVGSQTAQFIEFVLNQLTLHHAGIVTTIISSIALIITALGVFTQLEYSLGKMWRVPADKGIGIINLIKKYFIAFLLVISFGILVAISAIVSALWTIASPYLARIIHQPDSYITLLTVLELLVLISVAFTILYKYIPGVHVSFKAALIGGVTGSVLFAVGRELIDIYFRFNSYSINAYGAASFLILMLLWIYYSSQIFFLGAALTYVIDHRA